MNHCVATKISDLDEESIESNTNGIVDVDVDVDVVVETHNHKHYDDHHNHNDHDDHDDDLRVLEATARDIESSYTPPSSAVQNGAATIATATDGKELPHHENKTTKKKKSSIFASRSGHTLDFENVMLSTITKNSDKVPSKQILRNLHGNFPRNTLTAVMGPSGSGKTSLLKILTGRIGATGSSSTQLHLEGAIRLDSEVVDPTDIDIRRVIAYVEQDVSIPATCTPREAIAFSARLRLDTTHSDHDVVTITNEIIATLRLEACADTLIGGGPMMTGGLSGGEKKRVQVAVELVTRPEIIVLDEPTSGLDSYSAQNLMDVLKQIADAGATVIVTIHQPPPPVVRKIDNLLLLLQGRTMYIGPMDRAEAQFAEYGYSKPDDYNIADWILQVAQANPIEELDKAGFFVDNGKKKQEGPIKINGSSITKKQKSAAASLNNHVGFGVQTRLLFGREIKNLWRDKFSFLTRVGSSVVFGLLFGLIFLNVGKSSYDDYPEVMASFGAIANLLISTMFGVAQSSLTEFPKDRPVFLREYSTNHYSVLPYFLAKFTMECILILVQVGAQLVVSFFLMGFQMNFFLFLAVNFMLAIASTSIGVFIGSTVEDPAVAAELMPALIVPQLLFSGFFIQIHLIPAFLRWAQYLCSLTYAIRLVSLFEFGDCSTASCQSLLENNEVNQLPSYWYWIILFAISAIFRLTAMLLLRGKATF